MKKVLFFFALFCVNQLAFAQNEGNDNKISVSLINNDRRLSDLMRNSFSSLTCNPVNVVMYCEIPAFRESDFDFVNIYKSEKTGESEIAYSVRYRNPGNGLEYSFSVTSERDVLTNPMLVKTNTDRSRIIYNALNENKCLDVINNNNSFTYNIRDVDYGAPITNRLDGCGQCVMDCIMDAYSNHGWTSVWATIQSIFIPATGVGIALGCGRRCCL